MRFILLLGVFGLGILPSFAFAENFYISPVAAGSGMGTGASDPAGPSQINSLLQGSREASVKVYFAPGTYFLREPIRINRDKVELLPQSTHVILSGGISLTDGMSQTGVIRGNPVYSKTLPAGLPIRYVWSNDGFMKRARDTELIKRFSYEECKDTGECKTNHYCYDDHKNDPDSVRDANIQACLYQWTKKRFRITDLPFGLPSAVAAVATLPNKADIEVGGFYEWRFFQGPMSGNMTGQFWDHDWGFISLARAHFFSSYIMHNFEYLENSISFMDEPKEWFYDKHTGVISIILPLGVTPASVGLVADAGLEQLLSIQGSRSKKVEDITVGGIEFRHSGFFPKSGFVTAQVKRVDSDVQVVDLPAALEISNAKNIRITNNTFRFLGADGIGVRSRSSFISIDLNRFSNIGGTGIVAGETPAASTLNSAEQLSYTDPLFTDSQVKTSSIQIMHNSISSIGEIWRSSVAIFGGYIDSSKIVNNTIRNTPYTGISLGWGWGRVSGVRPDANNQISNNLVLDTGQELRDGGGIYTLGPQNGSVISTNWVERHKNTYGAIYLDNGSSGFTVRDNYASSAGNHSIVIQDGAPVATDITAYNQCLGQHTRIGDLSCT